MLFALLEASIFTTLSLAIASIYKGIKDFHDREQLDKEKVHGFYLATHVILIK